MVHQFYPGRKRSVVLAILSALLFVGCLHTTTAAADSGYATAPQDFSSMDGSVPFNAMLSTTSGAQWARVRFIAPWDIAGTQSSSGSCEATPNPNADPNLTQLENALRSAEAIGLKPVIALGKETTSANASHPNPLAAQYNCGLTELIDALSSAGVLPSTVLIEPYNEPDNAAIGSACKSGEFATYCAADYTDIAGSVLSSLKASGVVSSYYVIAGSFSDSSGPQTTPSSSCGNVGSTKTYYAYCYWHELSTVFSYVPNNWAFHDYYDVDNSYSCTGVGGTGCSTTVASDFNTFLTTTVGLTSPQIWMTEAGIQLTNKYTGAAAPANGGTDELDGYGSSYELNQANAAEGWLNLHYKSYIQHSFYYELQTYGDGTAADGSDTFDSALIGIDAPDYTAETSGGGNLAPDPSDPSYGESGNAVPRASFCVLAYNETASVAVADPRCDYATGAEPDVPWTAWEGTATPSGTGTPQPTTTGAASTAMPSTTSTSSRTAGPPSGTAG